MKKTIAAWLAVLLLIAGCSGGQASSKWDEKMEEARGYAQEDRLDEAYEAYAEAIQLDEEKCEAYLEKAEIDSRLSLWEEAGADYARAFELNQSAETAYLAADAYAQAEGFESQQEELLRKVIELYPEEAQAYFELYNLYLNENNTEGVLEILEEGYAATGDTVLQELLERAKKPGPIEDGITRTVLSVNTAEALLEVINTYTLKDLEVHIQPGTYDVGMLFIHDAENLTLVADGEVKLISQYGDDTILVANFCKNLQLVGLTMGHDLPVGASCSSGVILMYGNEGAKIIDCDLYGCGLVGISSSESSYEVYFSTIHDCSKAAVEIYSGSAYFEDCSFSQNCYNVEDGSLFWVSNGVSVTLESCQLTDNAKAVKKYDGWNVSSLDWNQSNCTESGNGW